MSKNKFEIEFYTKTSGRSPIEDFLSNCSPKQEIKIVQQFKYLREFGLNQAIPNIKKVRGTSFWELRILGRDNIRIFCAQMKTKIVIILHIFKKKRQKTNRKDINLALKRYQEALDS